MAERLPIELDPLEKRPLVSILITNYNYGKFIGEALESCITQTYCDFEVIVCDDGSSDNSREIIELYQKKDPRIKAIFKSNGGQASALNAAYKASTGSVICLLDADDLFVPTKLEAVLEAFRAPLRPGFVLHRMRIIYGNSKPGEVFPIFTSPEVGYLGPKLYKRGGQWRNMPASAISFRREVAELIFPIDEDMFRSVADGYIFTIVPILTVVGFVDEVLSFYRLHENNLTSLNNFSVESIRKKIGDREKVIMGVNKRLANLGLPLLEIEKHFYLLEQKTCMYLVDPTSSFWGQIKQLLKTSQAVLGDNSYALPQKVFYLFVYWGALVFPKGVRPSYLRFFMYPSKIKGIIRQILSTLRIYRIGRAV